MPFFTDQTGHRIELMTSPQRIVSAVPSQTELLFDLGLEHSVAGITKFCVHPTHWRRIKTRIGGTKTLNIEKIKSLRPHLVLAAKEENVKEQIERLASHFPVWTSDVKTVADALEMMGTVGRLASKEKEATALAQTIAAGFAALPSPARKPKVAYLIWKDPYMTAGGDTFISDMLDKAGFENAFANRQRYPITSVEELRAMNCELIFLSSEPYPFGRKHAEELQAQLPRSGVVLVNGEMFSWYGSRLKRAPAYFQTLRNQVEAAT